MGCWSSTVRRKDLVLSNQGGLVTIRMVLRRTEWERLLRHPAPTPYEDLWERKPTTYKGLSVLGGHYE